MTDLHQQITCFSISAVFFYKRLCL